MIKHDPDQPSIKKPYRLYLPKHLLDEALQFSIPITKVCRVALEREIYIAKQDKNLTKLGDL